MRQQQQLSEQSARLRWYEARQRNSDAQMQAQQQQLSRQSSLQRPGAAMMGSGLGAPQGAGQMGYMRQTFNPINQNQQQNYSEPVKPGRSGFGGGRAALIVAISMVIYYMVFGASIFGYSPWAS